MKRAWFRAHAPIGQTFTAPWGTYVCIGVSVSCDTARRPAYVLRDVDHYCSMVIVTPERLVDDYGDNSVQLWRWRLNRG